MRLQIITFIFLALCLGVLALFALHLEVAPGSTPAPPPNSSDSTPSQYRL